MDRPYTDEEGKIKGCDICPYEFKCGDFCKYFAYPIAEDGTLIMDREAIEEFFNPPCSDNWAKPIGDPAVASDSSDFLKWFDDDSVFDDDSDAGPTKTPVDDGKEW